MVVCCDCATDSCGIDGCMVWCGCSYYSDCFQRFVGASQPEEVIFELVPSVRDCFVDGHTVPLLTC